MTSQCRCTRTLSQSHVAKHDNHVPVTPLIGSGTGCHVDAMAAVWRNHIGKNIKITFKLRPTCSWRHKDTRWCNSSWNSAPLFLKKKLGSPKLHFYQDMYPWYEFEYDLFQITAAFDRAKELKCLLWPEVCNSSTLSSFPHAVVHLTDRQITPWLFS